MPHALLLFGQPGIGKLDLGVAIARTLLCEAGEAVRAPGGCGECAACLWFDRGNHPDYRLVTTEERALAAGLDDAETNAADGDAPAGKKAPSREIRFQQLTALKSFLSVATHRGGYRIVLVHPAETMNATAANMLLKVLEEPPDRTVFLLVSDRIDALPATIVSRCRKLPVPTPSREVAVGWLREQGVADAAVLLASAGGAPHVALAMAGDEALVATRRRVIEHLERPDPQAALALAESLARSPIAPLVTWMQQWTADCIATRLAGTVRYHPAQAKVIAALVSNARIDALFAMQRRLASIRRSVDHPLNARLVIEGMLIDYGDSMRTR